MYKLEHVTHKKKLYIKIRNEVGKEVYVIKDSYHLFSKVAHIKNSQGQEVAEVHQLPGITPCSKVSCTTGAKFKVIQAFSMRPQFNIQNSDFKIEGRIYDTDYVITKQGKEILRCRSGDGREKKLKYIDVYWEKYEIEAISIVIAIEAAKRNLFVSSR